MLVIYSQWERKVAYNILLQEFFTDRELHFSYHRVPYLKEIEATLGFGFFSSSIF